MRRSPRSPPGSAAATTASPTPLAPPRRGRSRPSCRRRPHSSSQGAASRGGRGSIGSRLLAHSPHERMLGLRVIGRPPVEACLDRTAATAQPSAHGIPVEDVRPAWGASSDASGAHGQECGHPEVREARPPGDAPDRQRRLRHRAVAEHETTPDVSSARVQTWDVHGQPPHAGGGSEVSANLLTRSER
jgi:hypothetical protein